MTRFSLARALALPAMAGLLTTALAFSSPALAQDSGSDPEAEDDATEDAGDDLEDEGGAPEEVERPDTEEDELDLLGEEEELDDIEFTGEEPDEDLLGENVEEDTIDQEGQDNSKIYREAVEEFSELAADEEMLAWDRYLQEYPNTLYRQRIERRLDDLEEMLYLERRADDEEDRLDADQRDVPISHALLLQNINPTTRVQTGFEWGLPDYINLMLDYEHGITREFSVHGGLRNRFQTWNIEFGARYALIKSSRTKTLLTGIMDFRFATDPAYLALRPQVAFGKMIGPVDLQAQVGVDWELRANADLRIIGGANATFRIDERVAVFLETDVNAKGLTWDRGNTFRFPVASFGLKLYPSIPGQPDGFMEVNLGASVPYATNYYRWHDGSIMGQLNIYL
jgi:hypothetical protein